MGFHFGKSIKFGPIRLNFSKSGIGVSTGVKGARISTGPKGTYIHAGRGGFYYRQKLDAPKTGTNQIRSSETRSPTAPQWAEAAIEVPQGKIIESIKPPKKPVLPTIIHVGYLAFTLGAIIWIAWYGLARLPHNLEGRNQVGIMLFIFPPAVWICGVIVHYLVARYTYVDDRHPLYYELDQKSAARFSGIKRACEALSRSEKVSYLGSIDSAFAGAAKSQVWISLQQPPYIATNVDVWAFAISNWKLFFLPDNIYVFQNNTYSTLPYESLRVSYAERQAYEFYGTPRDAQLVGTTWLHSRKDGGPDLRYKHNPMIPIVLYGVIYIESKGGWSMTFEASSVAAAHQFVEQITASIPTLGKQKSENRQSYQNNQQQYRRQSTSSAQTASTSRRKSAYEILGVNEGATLEEITEAYRKQARMNHPDKVANMAPEFQEMAEQRMKEINAAYKELSSKLR